MHYLLSFLHYPTAYSGDAAEENNNNWHPQENEQFELCN